MLPLLSSSCPPPTHPPGVGVRVAEGLLHSSAAIQEKTQLSEPQSAPAECALLVHALKIKVHFLFCKQQTVECSVLRLIWMCLCGGSERLLRGDQKRYILGATMEMNPDSPFPLRRLQRRRSSSNFCGELAFLLSLSFSHINN